jgi:hypothetical protein
MKWLKGVYQNEMEAVEGQEQTVAEAAVKIQGKQDEDGIEDNV